MYDMKTNKYVFDLYAVKRWMLFIDTTCKQYINLIHISTYMPHKYVK